MNSGEHDQDWARALRPFGRVRSIAAGDLILFQGEAAEHIGIIISGRASARINTERGDETWVDQFEVDDFFGHISLLTQSPIDFEIKAETEVKALFVPIQKFKELLSSDKSFSAVLARDLAARLNIMMNRLVEAVTLSSPGRVCAELLRLSRPVGIDPGTLIIRPTPVFVELAVHINSTRETVSRTVNKLLKSGILSREPGALLIHKPESLQTRVR
ncbi:MAG: Crp/Fnr family transcriptional regulator [Hellea sp.]